MAANAATNTCGSPPTGDDLAAIGGGGDAAMDAKAATNTYSSPLLLHADNLLRAKKQQRVGQRRDVGADEWAGGCTRCQQQREASVWSMQVQIQFCGKHPPTEKK